MGFAISGPLFCRMMRANRKTIRGLAAQFNLPMTRIRALRLSGAAGFGAEELYFFCTGRWPVTRMSVARSIMLGEAAS